MRCKSEVLALECGAGQILATNAILTQASTHGLWRVIQAGTNLTQSLDMQMQLGRTLKEKFPAWGCGCP